MMRKFSYGVVIAMVVCQAAIGQIHGARKMIVALADEWRSTAGKIFLFDKTHSGWTRKTDPWNVSFGDSGLAWGIGILNHPGDWKDKIEGDRCSPAGIFHIGRLYGLDDQKPEGVRYPYRKITSNTQCVDDVQSESYNRIVEADRIRCDWKSSEQMSQVVPDYKYVLVIRHNVKHERGKGSCIFLHINNKPTTGCTSMDEQNMLILLRWLNPKKKTLFVQLPRHEYERLKTQWKLPSVNESTL